MGQEMKVPEEDRIASITSFEEAGFDLSYDVAYWFECAAYFFHVRFLRDEHQMLWTESKCMDLRRFALLREHVAKGFENIYELLRVILRWTSKGVCQTSRSSTLFTLRQYF